MGLPAGQRKTLDIMEISLRSSDPRMVALFTTFTRLSQDAEMPQVEQIRAGRARRWFRIRAALFFPAALAFMACSMWLGGGFSGSQRCASAPRTIGISQLIANGRTKVRPRTGPKNRSRLAVKASGTGPAAACTPALWPVRR